MLLCNCCRCGGRADVGKLPLALPVLLEVRGISLLQAEFLLSLVQLPGMTLGRLTAMTALRIGLKRSRVAGLLVLGGASALGGLVQGAIWLLAMRALKGLGVLWIELTALALVCRLVPPERLNGMLGVRAFGCLDVWASGRLAFGTPTCRCVHC